jgi:hypothetical protein
MIKKNCSGCGKKIERKYDYCPWCGHSFKKQQEKSNFGMLGKEDHPDGNMFANELKLPFGFNKILNGLMKQIENEMQNIDGSKSKQGPRGFKIKVSTGIPGQMRQINPVKEREPSLKEEEIPRKEQERRMSLKQIEAESKVKRIGDTILYEITAPGIKTKKDIAIINLEQGIQIKIYTKDACYVKTIPLKIEITNLSIEENKLIVEMKG